MMILPMTMNVIMDDIDRVTPDPGKIKPTYRWITDRDHNQWKVQRLAACEIKIGYKILIKDRLYPVLSVDKYLGVDDAFVDITLDISKAFNRCKLTELFWVVK